METTIYPIYNKIVPNGEYALPHIVEKALTLSSSELILLDIELHDKKVERTRTKRIIQYYNRASDDKRLVLDVMEGRSADIDKALEILERGKESHSLKYKRRYNRSWDITWTMIYEKWISEIKNIKSK